MVYFRWTAQLAVLFIYDYGSNIMGITEALLESGLGWVVSVVLGGVVVYLFRLVITIYAEKNDLQEQRRLDVIEARDKYNAVLEEFSRTNNLLLAKLSGGDK